MQNAGNFAYGLRPYQVTKGTVLKVAEVYCGYLDLPTEVKMLSLETFERFGQQHISNAFFSFKRIALIPCDNKFLIFTDSYFAVLRKFLTDTQRRKRPALTKKNIFASNLKKCSNAHPSTTLPASKLPQSLRVETS
jgi:hypothetical protein